VRAGLQSIRQPIRLITDQFVKIHFQAMEQRIEDYDPARNKLTIRLG
jgi:hypothetical protein